jgi:hypothetical protein
MSMSGAHKRLFEEVIPGYQSIAAKEKEMGQFLTTGAEESLGADIAEIRDLGAKILSIFDRMAGKCKQMHDDTARWQFSEAEGLQHCLDDETLKGIENDKAGATRCLAIETVWTTGEAAAALSQLIVYGGGGPIHRGRQAFAGALEGLDLLQHEFNAVKSQPIKQATPPIRLLRASKKLGKSYAIKALTPSSGVSPS